jgi:ribonuclease HII
MDGIVGIDEVGRGSWAGPLVVAAVILPRRLRGLKDSKLLTKKQRELMAQKIQTAALAIGMGWIEPRKVDELGLTQATRLAAAEALSQITCTYQEIIIDGNFNYLAGNPKAKALIKADMTVAAVSAASIVAKVARDQYMTEIAVKFPLYQFEKHVGYGTRLHREMVKLHGACELHRVSWRPFQEQPDV